MISTDAMQKLTEVVGRAEVLHQLVLEDQNGSKVSYEEYRLAVAQILLDLAAHLKYNQLQLRELENQVQMMRHMREKWGVPGNEGNAR